MALAIQLFAGLALEGVHTPKTAGHTLGGMTVVAAAAAMTKFIDATSATLIQTPDVPAYSDTSYSDTV